MSEPLLGRHARALRLFRRGRRYGYPLCCVLRFAWDAVPDRMSGLHRGATYPRPDGATWVPCNVLHRADPDQLVIARQLAQHLQSRRPWSPRMSDRLWFHSVDYRRDRDGRGLVNRGFWLHGIPRLMPLCRLRGHRPVVDGVDMRHGGTAANPRRSRWACCDRCGIRLLQPVDSDLEIGQPYTDPLPAGPGGADDVTGARGVIGGQLVIWGAHPGFSVEAKVGNMGSENTLAAHLHLGKLGALYLHTERHGTWLQRRLNPRGYESRVIGLSVHHRRLAWKLWSRRDASSSSDPWWMHRSVRIDPRDVLLGERLYDYEDVGEPITATVRMPAGDDHQVRLQLQRRTRGRKRLRRHHDAWTADWSIPAGAPGIDSGHGGIRGSSVELAPTTDPDRDHWVAEACGAIADSLTRDRARYGYRAPATAEA